MAWHLSEALSYDLCDLCHELIDERRIREIDERVTILGKILQTEQRGDPAVTADRVLCVPVPSPPAAAP